VCDDPHLLTTTAANLAVRHWGRSFFGYGSQ
jgi:hypothetical protein